ncbi:phage holin family protein [Chitinimonas viridis]|uniref:Phage holin family protein n=1 Tax=Chitinimonas viridis TaxID=664880 RepID=A0ABT8B1N7_9NEIS|nr:phage holin family protein [Chitinimonas viridis]MDN3575596.1 phage holin family protein [Chitinimonas viridis]
MKLLAVWVINALSLLLVAYLLPGIKVDSFLSALWIALVLGLVNLLIRPVLLLLTLPVNFLTLGLFTLVINGFCFWLVAEVLKSFAVSSFAMAIVGAVVYSVFCWLATRLFFEKD